MAVKVGNSWVSETALAYAKEKASSSAGNVLDDISKQYPDVNFSTDITPFSQKGVKNIQIAPNILAEMENNPEKRLEYEALIYDCATGIDVLNHSGNGFYTKAAGFIINPDGSLGAWGISVSDDGQQERSRVRLDKNKKETWAEKIREKRKKKQIVAKKEEKIREKKKKEKMKQEEKTTYQSKDGSVTLELSQEAIQAQAKDNPMDNQDMEKEMDNNEDGNTKTNSDKDTKTETYSGKVGFNEGKRARQLAAAKTTEHVQTVMGILQKDLADCQEGLQNGMCDENEVNKVKAMIAKAQQKMGEVSSSEGEKNEADENAFAMSMLM